MPQVEEWVFGNWATLLTLAAAVANNTNALGANFDNTPGAGPGYTEALIEFNGTLSGSPTDNSKISLWFLNQLSDGATFEAGDGAIGGTANRTPARPADVIFMMSNALGATQPQTIIDRLPPGVTKLLIRNDSTSVSINIGATIRIRPFARQAVTV
jgi:hypothetical protein